MWGLCGVRVSTIYILLSVYIGLRDIVMFVGVLVFGVEVVVVVVLVLFYVYSRWLVCCNWCMLSCVFPWFLRLLYCLLVGFGVWLLCYFVLLFLYYVILLLCYF